MQWKELEGKRSEMVLGSATYYLGCLRREGKPLPSSSLSFFICEMDDSSYCLGCLGHSNVSACCGYYYRLQNVFVATVLQMWVL